MDKGQISKAFRLQGLQLQPAAMKYLIEVAKVGENQGLLEKILNSIDKNTLKKSLVDKDILASTVSTLNKQKDSKNIALESLKVVNAFDVPRVKYNPSRRIFVPEDNKRTLHADASAKADVFRERFTLIHQRLLLNPHFIAPILPTGEAKGRDYYQLTPIESLIGSSGRKCVLGMITQLKEGQYYLEDLRGTVKVDLTNATQPSGGLCCENSIVVAEGELINDIFHVEVLGLPPADLAETTKQHHPNVDFFGASPHPSLVADLKEYEVSAENNIFVFLSDVWLDEPSVMNKLKALFGGHESSGLIPKAFVLMGNFTKTPLVAGDHFKLQPLFDQLATLIRCCKRIAAESEFIIIPGPADPVGNILNSVPRHPIPKVFVQPLLDKLRRVTLGTNPCRIRYCTQEIVVFRDDITNKMRRHCILEPKDEEFGLSQHLVKTLCDQSHLIPLPLSIQPVYWHYDHALRLYPLPDMIILADKFAPFDHRYRNCGATNPGNFANDGSFVSYNPSSREVQLFNTETIDLGSVEAIFVQEDGKKKRKRRKKDFFGKGTQNGNDDTQNGDEDEEEEDAKSGDEEEEDAKSGDEGAKSGDEEEVAQSGDEETNDGNADEDDEEAKSEDEAANSDEEEEVAKSDDDETYDANADEDAMSE